MNKYTLLFFSTGLLVSTLLTGQPRPQGKPDFSNIEGKPDGGQSLERPKPRELISAEIDIKDAVKNGKISRKEAGQKLKALHEKFRENIKAKRGEKPELPDDIKADLDAIKEKKDALQAELKATLQNLGEDATQEQRKEAVESFKEANKERHQEIKAAYESIKGQIKESRPDRPERPELSDELKADLAEIKEKREALHEAQKELHQQLKNASADERKEMIAQFKKDNKDRHQEIKESTKALKEQIREQIEVDDTRTSDL